MKKLLFQSAILLLLLAQSVTGAFADEAEDEAEEEDASKHVCVNTRRINSYYVIDDQHLYIDATGDNHFLFTLRRRCRGLGRAHSIGVKETMSRVCSNGFGEIVFRDMERSLESCRIDTIEEVANKEDAKGLVEDRKEKGDDYSPPPDD